MDQKWNESISINYDVIVSLVQRSTNISAPASIDPNSPTMDEDKARKRTRSSNLKEEQSLGALHVNSNQLRHCSKYFDTCLVERWARTEIITSKAPLHLTLDVYTEVEYYRDCFLRMCSSQYMQISSINHCLKLLQVASQIKYLKLIEDCMCYLTSVPWSLEDEKKIWQFANSKFYPLDCAADLSARLGLASTNMERYILLLDITEQAVCRCFDDFWRLQSNNGNMEQLRCRKVLFYVGFQLIISGSCQTLTKNVLQHVNACFKQFILDAKEHPSHKKWLYSVSKTFKFLMIANLAKGLVEYIVDESPLCEMLQTSHTIWKFHWIENIFFLFYKVIEGHLLLKTSTRYRLIKDWTWILLLKENCDMYKDLRRSEVYKILSTFITTFPYEMQKEIVSNWVVYYTSPSQKQYNLFFKKIQKDWFESLENKLYSLKL